MTELEKWISDNQLQVDHVNNFLLKIDGKKYLIMSDRSQLFDFEFNFNFNEGEKLLLLQNEYDYYLFKFGHKFYYSPTSESVEFNEFRNIGKLDIESYPYLGIHGSYELCNGSGSYKEWVNKAKFFNINTLGLCEKNTLAGTILFQKECLANEIKPIIGETVTVKRKDNTFIDIRLFIINDKGWNNLLHINKAINVDTINTTRSIDEEELFRRSEGLICVLPIETELSTLLIKQYKVFNHLYYQIDPVVYVSPERDKENLESIKKYLVRFIDQIPCVIIADSYYIEKEDGHIKKKLNAIGKLTSGYSSQDQYFKDWNTIFRQINEIFKTNSPFYRKLINKSNESLEEIQQICDFIIKLGEVRLPKYEFNEEDKKVANTSEELFWHLINKGLEEKVISKGLDVNTYLARIEVEADIISRGGFIDYFLILWDIIKWSESNDIMVGPGRGSSGGSLIAYLIDITKIDPIKYDLIFERFLNSSRLGKIVKEEYLVLNTEFGDIDIDFNEKIRIHRDGQNIEINASEIKEGDFLDEIEIKKRKHQISN